MPHLLIAGNSGSGKSVCINAIIVSMLYRFSPDQLRFVMIDPKVVELQQYNTLPHLVLPVVMDPKKMILALRWIVNEVQKRYEIFAQVGVRNIGSFNSRPGEKNVKHSGDFIIPEKLSFVIVIIEHAEVLLQLGAAEIEAALGYLIESGRATGVHCVFTMDADSLNSFAEHIRVNIPSRIAFRCSSRSSSRLILGSAAWISRVNSNTRANCFRPRASKHCVLHWRAG
jgi:S-DNA-T family DNA segregation ATPase FtsK/SpoIIIE